MIEEKEQIIREREALIEMYKAGFLDGYSVGKRVRTEEDYKLMNRFYKMAFLKRFEKKINKILKKKK